MTIGVDAGPLSVSDPRLRVGVWRVVTSLLGELTRIDAKNYYRLYSFRPIEEGTVLRLGPRMKSIVLRPSIGWFSVRLPLELARNPVDVFLGTAQSLPRSTSYNIGFVYDVGFLRYPQCYPDSYLRLKKQTQTLVSRADHIIAISRSTADDVRGFYGVDLGRITVSYPGVGEHFFSDRETYQSVRPYVLFAGSLTRIKNVPLLLRAFAKFNRKRRNAFDLILAGGDYWIDPAIGQTISSLRLIDCVHTLGFVSEEELASLYRGAAMLVVPSLWEGFCLPAVEAMASGCPVVATARGSLPEVIGASGLLVDPPNISGLEAAMARLVTDRGYRNQLIDAGKKRAKRFMWSRFSQTVLRCIDGARRKTR